MKTLWILLFVLLTAIPASAGWDDPVLKAGSDVTLEGVTTLTGTVKESTSATITADVGSAQGGSPLTSIFNVISVCANAGDSATLPAAAAGLRVYVLNTGANSADVFPASGDAINEGSANAAKAVAANALLTCYAYDTTNWECRLAAAR
jgi:ABC-type amino acid transport system permease subunit